MRVPWMGSPGLTYLEGIRLSEENPTNTYTIHFNQQKIPFEIVICGGAFQSIGYLKSEITSRSVLYKPEKVGSETIDWVFVNKFMRRLVKELLVKSVLES